MSANRLATSVLECTKTHLVEDPVSVRVCLLVGDMFPYFDMAVFPCDDTLSWVCWWGLRGGRRRGGKREGRVLYGGDGGGCVVVESYAMERNCHFVDVLVQAKVSRSQNINSKLCALSADYVSKCDKGGDVRRGGASDIIIIVSSRNHWSL